MKVAIVHDWLVSQGGAERVLSALLDLYPADLFTLLYDEKVLQGLSTQPLSVTASFVQKLPLAKRLYRNYLPLFPKAIESFDLSGYDLIISSSHAVAKGIKKREGQIHICYCHTPMRYVWDLYEQYVEPLTGIKRALAKITLQRLKEWDFKSSSRVDYFIANSHYIKERIQTSYQRDSVVIYPPVDVAGFEKMPRSDFYITLSRLVPYKRVDLIVDAFTQMGNKRLLVIGTGPEEEDLKKRAGPLVEFLGFQPDSAIKTLLAQARALIFAAEEDFGIVPVEAQAAGTPVIAYGKGGALETVIDGKTGIFFDTQTPESLTQAISRFERLNFNADEIIAHAQKFRTERFKQEISAFVMSHIPGLPRNS